MDITERVENGVTVLDLAGKIKLGEGALKLREHVNYIVQDGQRKFLLNLKDITYIDAAGLGTLIALHIMLKRYGGRLLIEKLDHPNIDLAVYHKLVVVFDDIYGNEAYAIDAVHGVFAQ